jgi:polyhydroxyalkanoate depolymerase
MAASDPAAANRTGAPMLYETFQAQTDLLAPLRFMAGANAELITRLPPVVRDQLPLRFSLAASEVVSRWQLTHTRPPFDIASVVVAGEEVPVREEVTARTPFATLLRFAKDVEEEQPKVLVVAPMSGHFATLLRATVRTLLPDHDVYVTDWHNGRDVPVSEGGFGFDDYVEHVIDFLGALGERPHLLAVCQPAVPALAAAAVMAEERHPSEPASLTLMAGPIDARIKPTEVDFLACSQPITWFEKNVIARVPWRYPGAMRRVYPGFLQLTAFVSMNPKRHLASFEQMFWDVVDGNDAKAQRTMDFYAEYFAVLDIPAEFYLETVESVFQEFRLAQGTMTYRGRPVRPAAIRRTSLFTVEGENDDICGVGQTMAAHDLCTGIPVARRRHHLQPGVGHYGVFSGRRWERDVYPQIKQFIAMSA